MRNKSDQAHARVYSVAMVAAKKEYFSATIQSAVSASSEWRKNSLRETNVNAQQLTVTNWPTTLWTQLIATVRT